MPEISGKEVMTLRNKTGAGVMDCKNALKETRGDMEKAVEVLRKKGLGGLARRAGREMKEGRVALKFSSGGSKLAMAEINCETDFVAKNQEVAKVLDSILDGMLSGEFENPADSEKTVSLMREVAMKVGENMAVRRGVVYETGPERTVNGYVHGDFKKAAMVSLKVRGEASSGAMAALAKDLCMQCVAMNPRWLRKEDVPAGIIEKEKEIYRASPKAKGKPEAALQKMIEGRIKKFYEENCLLQQPFIRDTKQSVARVIEAAAEKVSVKAVVEKFDCYIVGVD